MLWESFRTSQLHSPHATVSTPTMPTASSRLRASAAVFELAPEQNADTDSRTGVRVEKVVGPLKTTVLLLEDQGDRVCLITTHFAGTTPVNVSDLFRQSIAELLGLPVSNVLLCTSHNHCSAVFARNAVQQYATYDDPVQPADLLPLGEEFLRILQQTAGQLPNLLQPVTVSWTEGHEGRITYNRKGRRADGTSYLMREEDRQLLGVDFNGDIDTQAPLVILNDSDGKPVAAIAHFTGHPVTSYHPEKPLVFGEWSQVACDLVAAHLDSARTVPIAFLQGCAADVNSKFMLSGDVERSMTYGGMLGQSYIDALPQLQHSAREGMDFAVETVQLPLDSLPSEDFLRQELNEMDDFIRRAKAGDDDTLMCAGQNFPRALSPAYRAGLAEMVRTWNVWALGIHEAGKADSIPTSLPVEISVLRIGDVGIVGMPFEPFQGIGRQIRNRSPLPINLPGGYTNLSHGYITDAANVGGQEYMSAHYRYTKFRPPLRKPAGDVVADAAVKLLEKFSG